MRSLMEPPGFALSSFSHSCEPAVFADWISIYLDLASTHREELGHQA